MQIAALEIGIIACVFAVLGFFFAIRRKPQTALPRAESPPPGAAKTQQLPIPNSPEDSFETNFYRLIFNTDNLAATTDTAPLIKAFEEQYATLVQDPSLLPSQPMILPKLLRAVRHDSGNAQAIVSIILEDPGLTADVLKLANSPLYRNSRATLKDLEYAVVMLGVDGLKTLATASLIRPIFRDDEKTERVMANLQWEYALASAHVAQRYSKRFNPKEAFTAHLLTLLTCISDFVIVQTTMRLVGEFGSAINPESIIYLMTVYRHDITVSLMRAWSLDEKLIVQLATPERAGCSHTINAQRFGQAIGRGMVLMDQGKLCHDEIVDTFSGMDIEPELLEYLVMRSEVD